MSIAPAMRTVPRLWRRLRTAQRVARPAVKVPGVAVAFVRFMYGALKGGNFTDEKEAEGRRRWVGVYDASVKVLRALPFVKR